MEPLLTLEGAGHFLLTPDLLLDHLLVECSPEGSNKKPEIDVHKFFCDYVQEVATREGTVMYNKLEIRVRNNPSLVCRIYLV